MVPSVSEDMKKHFSVFERAYWYSLFKGKLAVNFIN